MADPTGDFFARLQQGRARRLAPTVNGTIRFDVRYDERVDPWFVVLERGLVRASREARPADSVVHIQKGLLDRLVTGEVNYFAAGLRNDVVAEGDGPLLQEFFKLLPGPPGATDPGAIGRERGPRR